jgi:uncharacterized membrane protein HdeD (DUF308 family)
MAHEFIKKVNSTVKHWYIPLIVGLLFIGLGLWTIFKPAESYLGLAILFTLTFIIGGLLEIVFAIMNKNELDHWGWELANGILSFVIGVIMAMRPELSMITLPFYVGFVILFRSIMAISNSIELKKYGVMDWGNLMVMGILGLIFSFILLWNPMFAGLTIVVWTGFAFITIGGYAVYFSLKLKKLHQLAKEIKGE